MQTATLKGMLAIAVLAMVAGRTQAQTHAPWPTDWNDWSAPALWVTVGNPGNDGEWSGASYGGSGPDRVCGAVAYEYRIGKYEVTTGQYTSFLNAVAATDTYALYNPNMWSNAHGCKIQRSGSSGNYTYSVATDDWANRPVNYVSWGDAVRFANWLHNSQPTGAQGPATTEDGAYCMSGTAERQSDWRYAIASEDEWYKAAYHKNDGVTANYWDYATGTDAVPNHDLADTSTPNNANYGQGASDTWAPYYRTVVGDFENSPSPYGTFDQSGNALEWTEGVMYAGNRQLRGGSFPVPSIDLIAAHRDPAFVPSFESYDFSFRVVSLAVNFWREINASWHTAANWSLQDEPWITTDAVIDNGGTANVYSPGAKVRNLTVGDATAKTSRLLVQQNGTLTVGSRLSVGEGPGTSGHVGLISGAFVHASEVVVGGQGVGSITVNSLAELRAGSLKGNSSSSVWVDRNGWLDVGRNPDGSGGSSAVYAGSLSGSGAVVKQGSSSWRLSGDKSGFTGTLSVTGGVLEAGGPVRGKVDVYNGAVLSPINESGGDVGSLTVSGGLTLNKGSVYRWELNEYADDAPGINSDLIIQAGAKEDLVLKGGKIELEFLNGTTPDASVGFWQQEHTWTIIDNRGNLAGGSYAPEIDSPAWAAAGKFTAELVPNENDLLLTWTPVTPVPGSAAAMGARDLQEKGLTGQGVRVGMLEPALPWAMHDCFASTDYQNFYSEDLPSMEEVVVDQTKQDLSYYVRHATAVASIIAGKDPGAQTGDSDNQPFVGIAPGATIRAEACTKGTFSSLLRSLVVDFGADVVNLSLMTNVDASRHEAPENSDDLAIMKDVDQLVDQYKCTVVAAAGNAPSNAHTAVPARARNVIAVGILSNDPSTSGEGQWNQTSKHNVPGPALDGTYNYSGSKPDIVAPGRCYAAWPSIQGDESDYNEDYPAASSFATPHVTGAVALMIEAARAKDATSDLVFVDDSERHAVDPRAIKAALLTGADKSVTGWSVLGDTSSNQRVWKEDGQRKLEDGTYVSVSYTSAMPLDYELGAGGLNALEATKILTGEDSGGIARNTVMTDVARDHWANFSDDLNYVPQGSSLVATLVWNTHVFGDDSIFANLDLQLFKRSSDGTTVVGSPLCVSDSTVDNVEHIYMNRNLLGGNYLLKVVFDSTSDIPFDYETFALAYRVFLEPGAASLGNATAQSLEVIPTDFSQYGIVGMGARPLESIVEITDMVINDGVEFTTLKYAYSEAELAALEVPESSLQLYWYNEEDGQWMVAGNASNNTKNPDAGFVFGPPTDVLGDWGVEVEGNYVWANIDHASIYGIAGAPEPATMSLLALGGLAVLRRRRK